MKNVGILKKTFETIKKVFSNLKKSEIFEPI